LIFKTPAILDTCVLINLLATDVFEELASTIAPSLFVCSAVAGESIYLRSLDPAKQPEHILLDEFFSSGILRDCDCESEIEEELYVKYAYDLDDGEAMTLAIAQARGLPVATDEKKARRVIANGAPSLRVISTPEILHFWSRNRDHAEISRVLAAIRARARFYPGPDDPLSSWWNSF
jgi:predicted nucleic acid-binding protein